MLTTESWLSFYDANQASSSSEVAWASRVEAVLGPFTFLALWGFGPCYRKETISTSCSPPFASPYTHHGVIAMASFRPFGLLVTLATLTATFFDNFAAFGKAKVKLQRKAPGIAPTPQRRLAEDGAPRRLGKKVVSPQTSSLNDELEALALQVIPTTEDRKKKQEIWETLQCVCEDVLGDGIEAPCNCPLCLSLIKFVPETEVLCAIWTTTCPTHVASHGSICAMFDCFAS
eukprot:symbB.v1.2.008421.t1/scaffold529.1/size191693/6